MSEGPIPCKQAGCDADAFARFTWPGRDESYVCVVHAAKLAQTAVALGLHLQIIPLTADDFVKGALAGAKEVPRA